MTQRKANKLIKQILKEDPKEVGIFISLLSYEFMQLTGESNTEFLKRLKNSLKILEKDESEVN